MIDISRNILTNAKLFSIFLLWLLKPLDRRANWRNFVKNALNNQYGFFSYDCLFSQLLSHTWKQGIFGKKFVKQKPIWAETKLLVEMTWTRKRGEEESSTFQNMPSFARSGPTFCCFSIWFFMGDQFLQSHGSSRSKYSVTTLDSCSQQ